MCTTGCRPFINSCMRPCADNSCHVVYHLQRILRAEMENLFDDDAVQDYDIVRKEGVFRTSIMKWVACWCTVFEGDHASSTLVSKQNAEVFHSIIDKLLYVSIRASPLLLATRFLTIQASLQNHGLRCTIEVKVSPRIYQGNHWHGIRRPCWEFGMDAKISRCLRSRRHAHLHGRREHFFRSRRNCL